MTFEFKASHDEKNNMLNLEYVTPEIMKTYTMPPGIIDLNIRDDYLETFIIPEGVETAIVADLGLRTLYVPDSVKELYCAHNKLKNLDLPAHIENVYAEYNLLETLTFRAPPDRLLELDVSGNRLTSLNFKPPPSLFNLRVKFIDIRGLSKDFLKILRKMRQDKEREQELY